MAKIISFLYFFSLFTQGDAVKCFNCQAIPFPHDCAHLIECNSNEFCYTEQILTMSGNVVYNSGCIAKEVCSKVSSFLIGKRSGNSRRRATDISTCFECCADSFCNKKGCGVPEIPVDQRGPYCYNCDTIIDPKTCEKVAICLQHEVCFLYTPTELRGFPETLYRSKCGTQSTCDKMSTQIHVSGNQCSFTCCGTDFCNDECVAPQNTSMTTVSTQISFSTIVPAKNPPITTESKVTIKETTVIPRTHLPSSTKPPFHCNHQRLQRVDLSKHLKFTPMLLTKYIAYMYLIYSIKYYQHSRYWIGGRDYSTHNNFQWVNNLSVEHSVTDWARGEPTGHTSNEQECIVVARETPDEKHFFWHDKRCNGEHSYICERK